jgi:hypothetical protein
MVKPPFAGGRFYQITNIMSGPVFGEKVTFMTLIGSIVSGAGGWYPSELCGLI